MKPSSLYILVLLIAIGVSLWKKEFFLPIIVFGGFYIVILIIEAIPGFIKRNK